MTLPVALTVADIIEQIAIQEAPDVLKILHAAADALAAKSIAPAIQAALQAGEVAADVVEDEKFGPRGSGSPAT